MCTFFLQTEVSLCDHLETFQDLRLGFPKRPYFLKSVEMAKLGDPLKMEARDSHLINIPPGQAAGANNFILFQIFCALSIHTMRSLGA